VNARLPFRLAAAAGLWFTSLGVAQESIPNAPAAAQTDQRLAEAVAERIGQTQATTGARAEIMVVNGAVELNGIVTDAAQRAEIVRAAQSVHGVVQVRYSLPTTEEITRVNGQPGAPEGLRPPAGMPVPPVMGGMNGGGIDPVPLNGPGARGELNPPTMPPYAWPTYAPYNNYSRVAYPDAYPYSAFPYIGPMYPFPKVPLGYRAIKLEWEDGHWWYGRTSTKRDYWKVRYW
jgi:BON domain